MSLIMALETYEGIIMTADRLSTLYLNNDKLNTVDCFPKSYNTHKLFITKNGYGISSCGDSKLTDNYLVEQFLKEEICTKDFSEYQPVDLAQNILNLLKPYNKNCIFLMCGYYSNKSFTIEINSTLNEIYDYPDSAKYKVIRYGDTIIANAIFDNEKFHYGFNTYRLQDSIDLLTYTNQVVAKYQQFQETLQTVSENCDVLVLLKDGTHRWFIANELHI